MMLQQRVALVGLGWFGRIHLDAWSQVQNAKVVAVCDTNPRTIAGAVHLAQQDFHTDAGPTSALDLTSMPSFSTLEELLSECECDLVDLATPEGSHYALARTALASGKNVIVEKPLSIRAAHARALRILCEEAKKNVYVGNVLRFDPRYRYAIEDLALRSDRVRYMSLQRHFQRVALDVYGRTHPFFGACIHDIDIALWLHQRLPVRVLGTVTHSPRAERLDAAVAILEWDESVCVIQNSWHLAASCPTGFKFESQFFTEQRSVSIASQPIVEVDGPTRYSVPEFFLWPNVNDTRSGALVAQLQHFAKCAADNRASDLIPLQQAIWGIEVAEALLQSATAGTWITL